MTLIDRLLRRVARDQTTRDSAPGAAAADAAPAEATPTDLAPANIAATDITLDSAALDTATPDKVTADHAAPDQAVRDNLEHPTHDNAVHDSATHREAVHDDAVHDNAVRDGVPPEVTTLDESARDEPVGDRAAVGAFIDQQAFRLAQASVRDYAQLRASERLDVLLADTVFATALDKACWEAYPRALAMVGTLVEGLLQPHAGDRPQMLQAGLTATILENFDARPIPEVMGDVAWRAARADLERSLGDLAQLRSKTVDAVVQDHSTVYLAIMPLHPKLGADNFPELCSELKRLLLQIEQEFVRRADQPRLASDLVASASPAESDDKAPSDSL